MRVLCVNIPAGKEEGEFGQFMKSAYVPLLQRNFDMVKRDDTAITYRFCEWGNDHMEPSFYRYMDHLASPMVYHAAAHAEDEGFDAVVINCFGDPMLWELRQVLDIPVVGLGESTMLLSVMMGLRFGIVMISPYMLPGQEERIARYGLKERCAGMRGSAESPLAQEQALVDARETIEAFTHAARELIAGGADILIPGCSLISPAMRLTPGAEQDYPQGVTEIDGVPIADVLGDTITLAEALVSLKRAGSSWISRKLLYPQPTAEAKRLAKAVTDGSGFKFWDVVPPDRLEKPLGSS
jgi:allantoin racemase